MSRKDIRKLVRALVRQGWRATVAKSGHWRLTSPADAVRNARADARKLGAQV